MKAPLLLSVALASFASCGAAFAQTNDQEEPSASQEDIVVTATRRAVRLQDVPIAITAFTQEELTERGAVGYEGLQQAPGAVLNRASANFNNFTARGIATNGYNANLQSTVAIYIDELPISANGNSTVLDPTLFDVERVEFLRGPQGTLFGSGSLSGAVRILTRSPDLDEFDFAGLVDFGQTGDSLRQRYNAMLNIPIIEDRAGLRLVGFLRDEEGYLDNVGTGQDNSNTLENWGGRAIFRAELTDRLSVRLMAQRENSDPQDASLVRTQIDRNSRLSDRPDLFTADLENYNTTVEYQFDGARFTSSTTWGEFDQLFVVDLAGTFNQAIAFALDAYAFDELFVEEARLASDAGGDWDWVIGGFYFEKRRDVDYNYRSTPAFLAARGITGLADEYYQRFGGHTDILEQAVFGELTYRFTEDFWVTGGLRYGQTTVQSFTEPGGYNSNYLTLALFGLSGPVTITPIPAATGAEAEGSDTSYRLSASYRLTPRVTTYATYSTGYRPPIVNARAGAVSLVNPADIVIPQGAESDRLQNYEIGLKGSWFENRLAANLSAYYIDWSDIQVQANRVSDSVQFATNIGAATSQGLEFEVSWLPIDNLSFTLNGAVNDSSITNLSPTEAAISGAIEGNQLASPHFQGSATIRYNFNVGAADAWVAGSIMHVGQFPGLFPNNPGQPGVHNPNFARTEDYDIYNLFAGIELGSANITGYIENVTDDDSITYVHPEAFIASKYGIVRPRTIGVRVGFSL